MARDSHRKVREIDDELKKEVELRKVTERTLEGHRRHAESLCEAMLKMGKEKNETLENSVDNNDCVIMALGNAEIALNDELRRRKEVEEELARKKLELEELRKQFDEGLQSFSEYKEYRESDIVQATEHFKRENKLGSGGFGEVYKGFLNVVGLVAVKKLKPETTQGQKQFRQEVSVLCKVRDPNIVTLIGACPEICALIYEFLPKGNLADRLDCKNNTPPLTWRTRIRIMVEICSALICLHSTKPHPIVHGDLKPQNILLDSNLKSKLGDFGISRLLSQSSLSGKVNYHETDNPRGTFYYVDPEFIRTQQLKTSSDVYSFGVVILVMVTGKSPEFIAKNVEDEIKHKKFSTILDDTAGNWPYAQARKLVNFALKCCESDPANRPVLDEKVLDVIKATLNVDSLPIVV